MHEMQTSKSRVLHVVTENLNSKKISVIMTMLEQMVETRTWKQTRIYLRCSSSKSRTLYIWIYASIEFPKIPSQLIEMFINLASWQLDDCCCIRLRYFSYF